MNKPFASPMGPPGGRVANSKGVLVSGFYAVGVDGKGRHKVVLDSFGDPVVFETEEAALSAAEKWTEESRLFDERE